MTQENEWPCFMARCLLGRLMNTNKVKCISCDKHAWRYFYFFPCLCLDKPFSYCTKSYKGELQSVTLTSTTTSVPFYQKLRIRITLQSPHVTSVNLASTLSKMWAASKTVVLSFACFCSDGVKDYLSLLG